MSTEQPSTYFVQDRSNKAERERVTLQDQMLTQSMGGVLPEQPDPTAFHNILDVGCGTGCWLIEAAKTYPEVKRLVGVDISPPYGGIWASARQGARSQRSRRVLRHGRAAHT